MVTTGETPTRVENTKSYERKTKRLWPGILSGAIVVSLGLVVSDEIYKTNRIDELTKEKSVSDTQADVALWAAQQGITQVIEVDGENLGHAVLSINPKDPKACQVTFEWQGDSLLLDQKDQAGNTYDTVEVHNGHEARAVLEDICPPSK